MIYTSDTQYNNYTYDYSLTGLYVHMYIRITCMDVSMLECVTLQHSTRAQLAQWLEHQTFNLRVAGSNPVLGGFCFLVVITRVVF